MSKLDALKRLAGGNAAESMARPVMHGASPATVGSPPAVPERLQGIVRNKSGAEIPLDRIVPDPEQPREEFDPDGLARLAESLRARGQLQPIRVRWDDERGRYVIVCGERRWRAAGLAGLPTMSCVIMDGPATPAELLALQLVENLIREDLRPVEQARAFRSLMDANGWSTHQLARELAITQSAVVRALALLELPEPVQAAVEQGALPPATAYELSKLEDAAAVAEVARQVVAEGLTRAEAVAAVRERSKATRKGRGGKAPRKVTTRTIRTGTGVRITLERARGLDPETILAAFAEAVARVRLEMGQVAA
jgi:ParB family chromosome partitioning protein